MTATAILAGLVAAAVGLAYRAGYRAHPDAAEVAELRDELVRADADRAGLADALWAHVAEANRLQAEADRLAGELAEVRRTVDDLMDAWVFGEDG